MSEQFAFYQVFRERGTIDGNQRPFLTDALAVKLSGDKFLPCTTFPENQHWTWDCC